MHGGTPHDRIIWPQILLKIQVLPGSGSIRDQHLVQEVLPNLFKLSAGQTENQTFEIWSQDLESGQSGPRNLASKATRGELRRRVFEWRPLVVQCSAVQCSSVQFSAVHHGEVGQDTPYAGVPTVQAPYHHTTIPPMVVHHTTHYISTIVAHRSKRLLLRGPFHQLWPQQFQPIFSKLVKSVLLQFLKFGGTKVPFVNDFFDWFRKLS